MGRTSKNWCESVEKTRKIGGILVLHRRGEMGLDESAMMYEFGLSEQDPFAADRVGRASDKTKGDKTVTSEDVSDSPTGETEGDSMGAPKVLKRPALEVPTPTAADMIARLETIENEVELQKWREEVAGMNFSVLNQKGLDYMASLKENALKSGGVYDDKLADQWKTPQPTPEPDNFTIKVQSGDTLFGIAEDLLGGDSPPGDRESLVSEILAENGIGPDGAIFVGQELIVPRPPSTVFQHPLKSYAPVQGFRFQVLANQHGTDIGNGRIHPGIDIRASEPEVRANVEGEVYFYQSTYYGVVPYNPNTNTEDLRDFGNYAVLVSEKEGKTYCQAFAHMDNFSDNMTQGQFVPAGTVLGNMGSTGASDFPHVHWEIRLKENVEEQYVNGNVIYLFNNLPVNGYYLNNQAELDQFTIDPYDFDDLLSGEN